MIPRQTLPPRAPMSSAHRFSYSLWHASPYVLFAKPDRSAAYKKIPQHMSVWPYQGFSWLRRYFIDTSTVFCPTAAIPPFDTFAATFQNLTLLRCPISSYFLFRQLENRLIIHPTHTSLCSQFFSHYHKLPILRTPTLTSDKPCGFAVFRPRGQPSCQFKK
jgi:hypothetical protein